MHLVGELCVILGLVKYKLFLGQVIPNKKATNEDTGGQANKWANR